MLDDVVDCLRCPHCGTGLAREGSSLRCGRGHTFDVARQGYVNLLAGPPPTGPGDTAAMVGARTRFLATGGYAFIADAVARALTRALPEGPGCLVDLGAGTGYYLAAALEGVEDRHGELPGLALDVSKHAARRAARAHPRVGAVVCDAWQALPVRDEVAAAVLGVFAPRTVEEVSRILVPAGAFVVVAPTPAHLAELASPLGLLAVEEAKLDRLDRQAERWMTLREREPHRRTLTLTRQDAVALAAMGPAARHADEAALAGRAAELPDPVAVTASVTVSVYSRR